MTNPSPNQTNNPVLDAAITCERTETLSPRQVQRRAQKARKALGPYGACFVWGCEKAGQPADLYFHAGEGDESPEVITALVLCPNHISQWDGRMAWVVAERHDS